MPEVSALDAGAADVAVVAEEDPAGVAEVAGALDALGALSGGASFVVGVDAGGGLLLHARVKAATNAKIGVRMSPDVCIPRAQPSRGAIRSPWVFGGCWDCAWVAEDALARTPSSSAEHVLSARRVSCYAGGNARIHPHDP